MLESFAAWLLNTYIGDYFGNVNTDQLRMSLHSGEIELERLPLKRDLIKHLGLPLEASTGYIGKISIKFPRWHLFTSEPLVITIDELYLLVKPITNFTYNEEEENRAQQEFKMSQLDMLEQRWKALHEEESQNSSYYSSSYSSWLRVANYGSSFFTNILLNVHLKVSSIHLRYEDQATIPGCPFATGVLIRSLSVCSTDEHWTPKYVTREALADQHHNLLFKAIELESFAVYFDTDTGLYQNPKDKTSAQPPLSSLVEHMRANVERNRSPTGALFDHNYIIAPVNGRAHLKRNSSELSLKSCRSPRTVIDVQLEQVPIMMTAVQYKHLLDWSLAFQTSKTLWRYRKWRPMISRRSNRRSRRQRLKSRSSRSRTVSIEEGLNLEAEELEEEEEEEFEEEEEDEEEPRQNRSSSCRPGFDARTWWHFAVNANLEEYRQRRQRFNWAFILRRARDVVAYHSAYLHYLITPELYGKEMRAVKERVEAELSLDEICSIREVVFAESDRLLREQQQQQQQQLKPYGSAEVEVETSVPENAVQSGSWFFPYSLLSNMYYSYGTSSSSAQPSQPSQSTEVSPTEQKESAEELKEEAKKKKKHRRNLSTSSTGSFGTPGTDDIFLLRDAVFCQFNFQIRNSSFQLIAFNSLDGGESGASSSAANSSSSSSSGNLLLEFEFNKMAIGVDITNPNAYACVCHMNQGWRRRAQQPQQQQDPKQTSPSKAFLTQNELNMLQFNLAFECRHLELTLLRTEGAPIISSGGAGSAEASRLATAQLTGCGLVFVFSSHFVSIDGRLDSLEILDLVGAGSENRHRRVLSIGAAGAFEEEEKEVKESLEMVVTEVVAAAASSGEDRSFRTGSGFQNTSSSSELEKAFSFGLSRTFTENVLRLNILMASFVYVHSPVLVAEISRCRECFSDVLEAYFSRSFKERVKAATTEMLRGIVKTAANASSPSADNSTSGDTSKGDGSFKTELGPRTAQKLSLGTKGVRGGGPVRQKPKSQQISPFIDNFKLNIFISSPVIIFPISPASYEVVVCHLGHMLLNNHSHSSELMISSSKKSSRSQVMMNGGLKYSTFSSPNISSSSANSASGSSTSTSTNSDSYNAEIRDLSVYSLDCARNIAAFEELSLQQGGGGGKTPKEKGVRGLCSEAMPMAELYACEPFGVPILSKTVVEIVLEKKVLMSSLMTEGTGTGAYGRPLSSRLSTSPQPPPHQKRSSSEVRSLPVVPKTSTSSTASGGSGGQEDSVLIDGLNIISTVNSIDAFRPPKKFSIRSHMVSSDDNYYQHQSHHHHHHHQRAILPKPELVLSVDVSSIDVRFSYTDVLVFLHILNTLVPGGNSTVTTSSKESAAPSSSSAISAGKKDEPKKDDEEEEDSALNMEELEELFRGELQRQRRKSSTAAKAAAAEEGKTKRKPSTTEEQPPKLSDLDPAQFKLALDKLQDLGFEYGESLRALALTSGDVIEAAFMLSSSGGDRKNEKEGEEKEAGNSDGDAHSQCTTRSADLSASNTEKSASYQNLLLMAGGANSAAQAGDAMSNSTTTTMSQGGTASRGASAGSGTCRKKAENSSSSGSSLLSSLSVIELRVASGTIRIIDDCNQLDIPLVELGVREARLLQQNGSPVIEATAQLGAAYCDLYNSHLGGWEPVVEEGARVAASWKIHHQRAQLKSMVASSGRGSGAGQGGHQGYKAARRKLALKVDVKRMVNLNVSRTMLDMVEKVQRTWVADIAAWMALPPERRCFRKRSPFIPFALKNETGSDVQLLLPSGGSGGTVRFSAGKGPDLVTHCDLRESIEASAGQVVCFDIVDTREQLSAHSGQSRWSRAETSKSSSSSKRLQTQKITVKVDGWSATPFPLSIEREGTFVRHIVSELYFKQSAVLVFDIALQPTTAVKLITVRSSLQVLNKTTKNVELSFANTAALGPKDERRMQTRYIIAPGGVLPVPLKLLYARMQLRPCDLGLGACRTPINWSHVRRYGEQQCSLQICTPITHSSAASYSASAPYVVTVLVERNSIGALVESRKASSVQNGNVANGINATNSSSASMNSLANGNFEGSAVSNVYGHTPLVTIPSHTITLLPPLQLANRLPYELKFVISSSSNSSSSSSGSSSGSFSHHHHSSSSSSSNSSATQTSGVIKSGEDHSVHYVSPLEPFTVELSMEHFPRSKPLLITPGATKDYTAAVDMYDANGRLLVLQAAVTVVAGRGGSSGGALGALGGALGGGGSQPCNAMTITLYSPYWIVNRSGLPLIFAQEGVYVEAAGQGEEHERARALSPLLYSHAEAEAPKFAVMRLGRMTEAVEPRWCNYFLLEKGTFYRRLRVTECTGPVGGRSGSVNSFDPLTASPGRAHAHYFPPATEKIYEFGIDIRSGRDRYSNTKIVTIAPRYQIENLTTYRLEFAQKCMVDGSLSSNSSTGYHSNQSSFSGSEYGGSPIGHRGSFAAHRSSFGGGYLQQQQQQIISMSSATSAISALPKSNTPFHWPATDSPKLLVVRISSLPGCAWSGAFTVGAEPSASFHLNIRDDSGRSFFLRVEILLQSATYFIVFTEANQLPPPVRVENFSQVPIEFYQAGTTSLLQRTRVRPNSSIPYALDEPLLPSHLTVAAPGGACSTYDLNSFAPGDSLTYDNFYYIAFEETFAQATAFGFGGGGFYGTGYLAHDLDDDEQLMLMMLAGGGGGGGDLMDDNDNFSLGPGAQMLVLDVPDGTEYLSFHGGEHFGLSSSPPTAEMKPVLLTRKERGKRSQLWRIDVHSRIIHEGSCPPVEPGSGGLQNAYHHSTADLGFADVKFGGGSRSGGNGGGGLYHHRSSTMVLDVADEGGACYDGTALPLVIRRLHPARERTQTWHWTADGRLRCAKYEHLFVAPRGASPASSSSTSSSESSNLGAIFRSGNAACLVLGPMEVKQSGSSTAAAAAAGSSAIQIPRTQAVLKQKMRKGSGVLNVSIQADGPSRVLRIRDQQMSANGRHLRHQQQQQAFLSVGGSPLGLGHFGVERSSTAEEASSAASAQGESALVRLLRSTELELSLAVDAVGVSVISAANEELIYLFLRRISLEATLNPAECRLRAVVMNFQVDNQLRHCEKEVVLHVGSLNALEGNGGSLSTETAFERDAQELVLASSSSITPPAITFIAQKLFIPNVETNVFKNLQVSINDLVLNLEEVVLLKLLEFIQYDPVDSEMDEISSAQSGSSSSSASSSTGADALYHANSRNVSSSLARSAQYYFAYLLVQLSSVKLSVFTSGAHRVGAFLSELKKKAGIKLIRFEDALIQLRPYHRVYSLMTRRFLTDSIKEHYRAELRSQAAKILGTVDFLGNPVGFLNDMADGISDLTRGNLSGLLWSVTHGISDSTAKFTSVLGESLGTVTMDARYQEIRRKIKQESSAAAGGQRGHLSAGALGLAHGLIGGITSLITQTYDGFTQGSVTGVLSGLGKGVLGTITKPAVGVLDFASSAATAVRDSSRKTTGTTASDGFGAWEVGGPVRRVRRPRTLTIDGRLTAYDAVQAAWQARFYSTGDFGPREYGEAFVAVTLLQDGHLVMVTTERLLFFHSLTLKRADLEAASAQEEGDLEGDSRLLAENVHHHLAATDCPVNQLQILALETISEAVQQQEQ